MAADAEIFNDPNRNQKNGVDLMLARLGIMLEQPEPTKVTSGPDLAVTPDCNKESGHYKQTRPDVAIRFERRKCKACQHEQANSNQSPASDVMIELRRTLVWIHREISSGGGKPRARLGNEGVCRKANENDKANAATQGRPVS
jgi:hypothetical protein